MAVTSVAVPDSMHVGDLDGSATVNRNWTARVTMRIDNATHGRWRTPP